MISTTHFSVILFYLLKNMAEAIKDADLINALLDTMPYYTDLVHVDQKATANCYIKLGNIYSLLSRQLSWWCFLISLAQNSKYINSHRLKHNIEHSFNISFHGYKIDSRYSSSS